MASLTRWTWVCVNSRSWWTGRPGVLWFMGSKRVRHDWATELNWNCLPERLYHLYFWLSQVLTVAHGIFTEAYRLLSSCGSQAHVPWGLWDLSSLTRDPVCTPCNGRQILNHWTTREILRLHHFMFPPQMFVIQFLHMLDSTWCCHYFLILATGIDD